MAGGRGRGRTRATATPSDPSPSTAIGATGASPSPSPSASARSTTVGGRRACESCEAAPGMPFCRVEWSFLCASCGPALHRNSWIVAVPPFPGSGPNPNTGTGIGICTGTGTDASQVPPPYYFPPFMQMPHMPPMHTPFQMPMPVPMHPSNPSTTTGMAGKKRRRRPRVVPASKEQMPDHVPADTDSDPEAVQAEDERVVRHGMKRNAKSPLSPSTRTDTGDAYAELHPGVEETMLTNMPESAQVDAIENLAAEMEPPPTELDEIEHVIEEKEQQ